MTDDHRPPESDGPPAGRLEGISLPDLLWSLSSEQRTGTLTVRRAGVAKTVYLERGRILFASSSDPDDRLGELLLREGDIRLDDLEEALCKLHSGKRLGTLLVEAGRLSAGRLVDAVLSQVHGIVLDLFDWDEGEHRFVEGPLPTEEVITLGTRSEELLLQGIRRIQSFARIRRSVGPLRTVYGLADGWREKLTGLGVTEGERRIAVVLERGDATVDTLCAEVYLSNFEVYQALWAFRVIGVVAERATGADAVTDTPHAGSLARRDFAELLSALARDGATGVLHVARGPRERTFHIDRGRCVFATSNDIDDGLIAYLLRRGVISLRHREEIAKRLLSNRRVGTILSDLGVITDDELAPMVRQQLAEIVYDTFKYQDGEWAFVQGDLPTVEAIALESSPAALVAGGLRRIRSWGRVFRGCGGLDTTLELTSDYLAVLDEIGAGPDEWAVVTALKTPRTPRAVCRSVPGPDHGTCQLLWILRVLGAVRIAEQQPERATPAGDVAASSAVPAAVVIADEAVVTGEAGPAEAEAAVPAPPADGGAPFELAEPGSGVVPFEDAPVPVDDHEQVAPIEPDRFADGATDAADRPDDDESPIAVSIELDRSADAATDAADPPADDESSIPVSVEPGRSAAADPPTPIPVALDPDTGPAGDDGTWEALEVRTSPAPAPDQASSDASAAADGEPARADATQALDRAAVEAALRGDADTPGAEPPAAERVEAPPPDATQALDRAAVEAALRGDADTPGPEAERAEAAPPDATQALDRAAVEAALRGDAGTPAPDAAPFDAATADTTQALDRAAVEAALRRGDGADDPTSTADAVPDLELDEPVASETPTPAGADEALRTMRVDPTDVEALAAGSWEPPEDLDRIIERFNAVQRVLYRAIRAEVGAGAVNLIRSCCGQVDDGGAALVEAELRADGSWDRESLRRGVEAHRLDDPWATYQALIDREIDLLRLHVGEARAAELERQVERIERPDARA